MVPGKEMKAILLDPFMRNRIVREINCTGEGGYIESGLAGGWKARAGVGDWMVISGQYRLEILAGRGLRLNIVSFR
jgi:hypothetical protein